MSIAEKLDPDFNIHRVVFSGREFMKLINNPGRYKLGKGSFIVWDETGLNLGARDFMSSVNKAICGVLQVFRHRNYGVIFCLPNLSFLDVQARRLLHFVFETIAIDYENQEVITKPFEAETCGRWHKTYLKYPRFRVGGEIRVIKRFRIPKPSDELIEAYEKKKEKFAREFYRKTEKEIKEIEERKRKKLFDLEEAINYVVKHHDLFMRGKGKKRHIDEDLIAHHFGVGIKLATRVKRVAEKHLEGGIKI